MQTDGNLILVGSGDLVFGGAGSTRIPSSTRTSTTTTPTDSAPRSSPRRTHSSASTPRPTGACRRHHDHQRRRCRGRPLFTPYRVPNGNLLIPPIPRQREHGRRHRDARPPRCTGTRRIPAADPSIPRRAAVADHRARHPEHRRRIGRGPDRSASARHGCAARWPAASPPATAHRSAVHPIPSAPFGSRNPPPSPAPPSSTHSMTHAVNRHRRRGGTQSQLPPNSPDYPADTQVAAHLSAPFDQVAAARAQGEPQPRRQREPEPARVSPRSQNHRGRPRAERSRR